MKIHVDIYSDKMIVSNKTTSILLRPEQPYHNERLVIAKLSIAEACLRQGLSRLGAFRRFKPNPEVTMQQQELFADGLSELEVHCLRELALAAGARKVTINV